MIGKAAQGCTSEAAPVDERQKLSATSGDRPCFVGIAAKFSPWRVGRRYSKCKPCPRGRTPIKAKLIKHWPASERPRERLAHLGPTHLSDAELLSILLGRGVAGTSALDMARELLAHHGGMRGVLNAGPVELQALRGLGPGKSAVLIAARECCCRYMAEKLTPDASSPPPRCQDSCSRAYGIPARGVLLRLLDNGNGAAFEELFHGTIDSTTSIRGNRRQARSTQCGRGDPRPQHRPGCQSPATRIADHRRTDALELVDVRLLDHFVVARRQWRVPGGGGCCRPCHDG